MKRSILKSIDFFEIKLKNLVYIEYNKSSVEMDLSNGYNKSEVKIVFCFHYKNFKFTTVMVMMSIGLKTPSLSLARMTESLSLSLLESSLWTTLVTGK